jgi:hypothetical protein
MHELFDLDGVLVGWMGYSEAAGHDVFVPRRDEDIELNRRAIATTRRPAKSADAFEARTSRDFRRRPVPRPPHRLFST